MCEQCYLNKYSEPKKSDLNKNNFMPICGICGKTIIDNNHPCKIRLEKENKKLHDRIQDLEKRIKEIEKEREAQKAVARIRLELELEKMERKNDRLFR